MRPASSAVLILKPSICSWACCARTKPLPTASCGRTRPSNPFASRSKAIPPFAKQIEGHTTIREKVSTSVDLPLSHECKRVLAYGAEEAERRKHKHIGTEHLLLGLLREEKCFAAEILHERGLRLSTIREELARSQSEKVAS